MTAFTNEHASSSSSNSLSSLPPPSSSRTSLNLDTAHMHKPSPPARHIRFAPLLDPRRAVVVTDDGNELPIKDNTHFPAAASLSVLRSNTLTSQTAATSCSVPPLDPSTSGSPSPSSAFSSPTDLQSSSSGTPCSPGPHSRTFTVDILKPTPPTPKQKRKSKSLSISPEEILTLGTINLFRSSTFSSDQDNFKENNDPASTPSSHRNSFVGGWGLLRRTSGNPSSTSVNAQTGTEILGGNPPLTRLQAVQEGPDRKKRRSSIAAFFSAAPGVSSFVERTKSKRAKAKSTPATPLPPSVSGTSSLASGSTITNGRPTTPTSILPSSQRTPRHKGARMLNGRIYGAKPNNRISENPFANARDDEPEFVEWGYGGMGSVKGARSAGVVGTNGRGAVNWERLLGGSEVSGQGGQTGFMVPGGGRGGAAARRRQEKEESRERRSGEADEEKGAEDGDGEEDDGSGLAWIRKRRKMREEKEKRMKEAEQAHEKAPTSESIPTSPPVVDPDSETQTATAASVQHRNLSHGQNGVDEHRHANSSQDSSNVNGHHDHVMKAVSVPMSRTKLPSHHRRASVKGVTQAEEAGNSATVVTADDHDNVKLEGVSQQEARARPASSESSSSASSSSESSDEESDSDGEDSSGEDQDENEKRRTAIGAGVEKVTASFRHRGE